MAPSYDPELVMLAELRVKLDSLDTFLRYTTENQAVSRARPGNISFDMLVDEARPGLVFFHEVWASAEAQRAYLAWRAEQGDVATLLSMLEVSPTFTALRRVAG